MPGWRTVLGLALLIAALASGWAAWRQAVVADPPPALAERSDYLMRDFEMISLDDAGKESVTLRAPEMQRNAADQTYQIDTPLFLLPDSEGQHWEVRSRTAWVSPKGDEIRLQGEVDGRSPAGAAAPTTLATDRLDVFPRHNLATTESRVIVTRPGSVLSGVGFETDTRTQQYTFKSQVRSRYEPNATR